MIRAEFFAEPGYGLTGFRVSGHNGEAGRDIVCAAVSSAAYLTANTITDVIGADASVSAEDGLMSVRVPRKEAERCRAVLEGFRLHITGLAEEYPQKITVIQTEV